MIGTSTILNVCNKISSYFFVHEMKYMGLRRFLKHYHLNCLKGVGNDRRCNA